jgi:serine/threonine protein phosphatase 1
VARLAADASVPGIPAINLMGNHEHMMLAALASEDAEATELWLANGGGDSLRSWGVPSSAQPREWPGYLPRQHLILLRDLAMRHTAGGYIFVHAGIRPGIPLERQSRHDLMWIREPFLSSKDAFPGVVVHGHTPKPEPVVKANRIGIDTGAVMGGALTCAVLEDDRLGFITA